MRRIGLWCAALCLVFSVSGCSTENMPGYQNTYQGYDIPESLLNRISQKFREHNLAGAEITRDLVGRVRLAGSYRNEDDVDAAFTIVQSIIGIKSTSPFYPQNVAEKRWEAQTGLALSQYFASQRSKEVKDGVRRALVIGINDFQDPKILSILGEDDARQVAELLSRQGYRVTSLFGSQATKKAIENAVVEMERVLGGQDTLFIYVSSHGTPPLPTPQGGDGRKMSIVAYDTGDTQGPRSKDNVDYALKVQRTSVSDAVLQRLALRPSKVTRVLVDTCYSGEILKDAPEDSRKFILAQNGGQPERHGVSLQTWAGGVATAKGIEFVSAGAAKSQAKALPFQTRPGYTFITATSAGEQSWGPSAAVKTFTAPISGSKELKGSFFTQTFSAWLQVHNGQLLPAFEQASAFTRDIVVRESGGKTQTPRMFSTVPTTEDNLFKL
jgi:Caspase domain